MSGTFRDMNVPPTLVSFALAPTDVTFAVSPEFKKAGSSVVLVSVKKDDLRLPDFVSLDSVYTRVNELIRKREILSASSIKAGGLAETISKMCFGNGIGVRLEDIGFDRLFMLDYGSLVVEVEGGRDIARLFEGIDHALIGTTTSEPVIMTSWGEMQLDELIAAWMEPLEKIFPTKTDGDAGHVEAISYNAGGRKKGSVKTARPRVFIPVFPGTNCEYDLKRKFEEAGALTEILVLRNLTAIEIEESIAEMKKCIDQSNIIMIPGGFSAGDEPDGSGKFIATVFRNPYLTEAVMNLLNKRDGLILGICNGFQALVKLGLLPYGEIRPLDETCPTLTFNTIGRHVSTLVRTRVASNLSPWLSKVQVGEVYTVAVSHGEGRFVASGPVLQELVESGQIATQYVDPDGNPTMDIRYNPNGSVMAIEGITSRDGRIFGKMAHDERFTPHAYMNVPGKKDQKIFESGVSYFL